MPSHAKGYSRSWIRVSGTAGRQTPFDELHAELDRPERARYDEGIAARGYLELLPGDAVAARGVDSLLLSN